MSELPHAAIQLETVPCDLCGGSRTRERYRKPDVKTWITDFEFPVVECAGCGLVFVNPRPTPASMAQFYRKDYHEGRDSERHTRRYARQLKFMPPLDSQTWLDVGCARGDFLSYVLDRHPGLHAYGVDTYSDKVNDPRIHFVNRPLDECGFAEGQFDLVTAWAVFEHLHQPSRYFAEVQRVLKRGGRFVFLVTNADSLYGRRGFREDVPRHTYHFSPAVLARYAEKHGFAFERLAYDDGIFDGRGKGTFQYMLSNAAGVGWPARRERRLNLWQAAATRAGKTLDRIVFAPHWEARLSCSGIIVVDFVKP